MFELIVKSKIYIEKKIHFSLKKNEVKIEQKKWKRGCGGIDTVDYNENITAL